MDLSQNLQEVVAKILVAESSAKREKGSVRLLAVSKTVTSDVIKQMYELGQREFGENRPQVLRDKVKELESLDIKWHFIGHLQRNKAKQIINKIAKT